MPTPHVKTDPRRRISLAKIPGIKQDQYYRVELGVHGRIVLEPVTFVVESELPDTFRQVDTSRAGTGNQIVTRGPVR